MPPNGGDKLRKIEELKNKLFSKGFKGRMEHRDPFTRRQFRDVADSWQDRNPNLNLSQKFFMQTSLFKKFFIFSIIFFFLTIAYGSYIFFAGGNIVSNENIEIKVLGNSFTAGGEEIPLQISITNKNNSALELADLIVEYPKSSSGDMRDTERQRISLGTIPAGSVRTENVKLVLFGEQGSVRPIKITLEYRVEGSNAIFVREKIYEVNINSTPIDLTVMAPSAISPNQEMKLDIKVALNSNKSVPEVLVKIDYPVGFQFMESDPKPDLSNNVWNLGYLLPGSSQSISVAGKMIDVFDGEEKTFRIWTGSQSKRDKYDIDTVFNSFGHTVIIQKPSLEAELFVNGAYQKEYAVDSTARISGEIRWINNLDTKINDLRIRARLSGNALNRGSITADRGFYDSTKDEIVWDKNHQDRLAEVNPGDAGVVAFSFSPNPLYSASAGMLSNPVIDVRVSISGKQEVEGFELKDLNNEESKKIKIISDLNLAVKALYYSGAFTNAGPIPPQTEKETTYTVVWSLSNTSNNISKAAVRSTLPSWVRFMEAISPASEDLSYNAATRELVWNIGNIGKGTGITAKDRQVSFKIGFTPSLSQVETAPGIINDPVLPGHDDFANVDVRVMKGQVYTRLTGDPSFPPGGDRVVE